MTTFTTLILFEDAPICLCLPYFRGHILSWSLLWCIINTLSALLYTAHNETAFNNTSRLLLHSNNSFRSISYFLFSIFAGDYAVKAVGVIPDPETFIFELESVDRFMILGAIFFIFMQSDYSIYLPQIYHVVTVMECRVIKDHLNNHFYHYIYCCSRYYFNYHFDYHFWHHMIII